MSLGKYTIVGPPIHLQYTFAVTKNILEYAVTDATKQPAQHLSARLVRKTSSEGKKEAESLEILQSVQSSSARRHLLIPVDRFEHADNEDTWDCAVYEEIFGPNLAWAIGMMGPGDSVWPASMIRSITKQTLSALEELRQSSAVLGVDSTSIRFVYPSLQGADLHKIREFLHVDEDGNPQLNDTCTGPAGSSYQLDSLSLKLNDVGPNMLSCSPEHILLNQRIPANDIFTFGTVLFDLAAGTIYDIEAEPTIHGTPSSIDGLIRSQQYLGKIPQDIPSDSLNSLLQVAKDPKEAIYKHLHKSLEPTPEEPSVATENDRLAEDDLRHLADLLSKMLDYNPETRITPADALQHPFFAK